VTRFSRGEYLNRSATGRVGGRGLGDGQQEQGGDGAARVGPVGVGLCPGRRGNDHECQGCTAESLRLPHEVLEDKGNQILHPGVVAVREAVDELVEGSP
jgi:hypothetical protein